MASHAPASALHRRASVSSWVSNPTSPGVTPTKKSPTPWSEGGLPAALFRAIQRGARCSFSSLLRMIEWSSTGPEILGPDPRVKALAAQRPASDPTAGQFHSFPSARLVILSESGRPIRPSVWLNLEGVVTRSPPVRPLFHHRRHNRRRLQALASRNPRARGRLRRRFSRRDPQSCRRLR